MAIRNGTTVNTDVVARSTNVPSYDAPYSSIVWFRIYTNPASYNLAPIWTIGKEVHESFYYDEVSVYNVAGTLNLYYYVRNNSTSDSSLGSTELTNGQWYCVATVRNSDTDRVVYLGTPTAPLSSEITLTTGVGSRSANPAGWLAIDRAKNGANVVGNTKFWTRALSLDELIAEQYKSIPVSTENLIAWLPFVETGSGRGQDLSGNGDLTTSGTFYDEDGPPLSWGAPALYFPYLAAASGVTVEPTAASAVGATVDPTVDISGSGTIVAPDPASAKGTAETPGIFIAGTKTISQVGSASVNSSTGSNTVALTLSSGWQAGDLAIAAITVEDTVDRVGLGTPADGWTEILDTVLSTRTHRTWVFYRVLQSGDSDPTWTLNASDEWAAALVVFRGISGAAPIVEASAQVNNSSTTSSTAPSVSILNGGYLLHIASNMAGSTWTPPSGYTELADRRSGSSTSNISLSIHGIDTASDGTSGTAVATSSGSDYNIGAHVSIRFGAEIAAQPVPASASGSTVDPTVVIASPGLSVEPAPSSAVAASVAPSVVLGSVAVTPAAASSVGASVAPTVVLGSLAITPTPASAVGATTDPTVQFSQPPITPDPASAVGASVAPTVVFGSITITAAPAGAIGASAAPVTVLGSLAIAPATAFAIGSGAGPTVLLGGLAISPTPASAIGATAAPTVVLGSLTIIPSAVSAVASSVPPSVLGGGLAIGPDPAGAVAASVNPVTVLGSVIVSPAAASAVGGGVDPAVIGGGTTVSPAAASCVVDQAGPVVVLGSLAISPMAAGAIGSRNGPAVILGSLAIEPAAAGGICGGDGPTVILGSVVIVPGVGSAVGKTYGPTILVLAITYPNGRVIPIVMEVRRVTVAQEIRARIVDVDSRLKAVVRDNRDVEIERENRIVEMS